MTTDDARIGLQPLSGEWPSRTTGETPQPAVSIPISLQELFYLVTDLRARLVVADKRIVALEKYCEALSRK